MKLGISPLAEQDMEAIGDFIAQDNPVRAVSFTEELYQQCLLIAESPVIYRERPEPGRPAVYGGTPFIMCGMLGNKWPGSGTDLAQYSRSGVAAVRALNIMCGYYAKLSISTSCC